MVSIVNIGDTTNFKVWVIVRPLPRQDQWKWKFSSSNSSNVMTTNPGHVLSITNVTISYYGNYYIWTNNQYGGWTDDELMFILKPQGPPSKPVNFHVIDVTAVSIRVQWKRGFNGGLDQTFTIRYTEVVSGVVKEKSGIEDRVVGSGQMITDDITDGIEPETEYQLQILADNSLGQVVGASISVDTPALAKFSGGPYININNDKAIIHFIVSGPLTHINVENCVEGTKVCVRENVTIPQKTRTIRQTSTIIHDFMAEVTLSDPKAKRLLFLFWIYDDDIVLYSEPTKVKVKNGPKNVEEHQYEMTTSPEANQPKVSTVYQSLREPKINIFSSSEIVLESVLSDGNFYQIWKGKLSHKQVVIKKTKECNDIHINYLKEQGLYLTNLRSSDYIIDCLGMTSDYRLLVMEVAPLGNLRQYLETKKDETYYNIKSSQSLEFNFIHQIIEGVEAVHHLDVNKDILLKV
ncbi:hypothetical protein LSH36_1280g00089 [Paralvinella palmiformis]|uniref:Uncharacterized protein n=1 Tax=Paralvinella palmiformis TaxID=53620 RepID=A0AAD9ITH5_9ANNE|nr:hypothetical protein LSH36_1280g00089 [Paralvinella palmiformis]